MLVMAGLAGGAIVGAAGGAAGAAVGGAAVGAATAGLGGAWVGAGVGGTATAVGGAAVGVAEVPQPASRSAVASPANGREKCVFKMEILLTSLLQQRGVSCEWWRVAHCARGRRYRKNGVPIATWAGSRFECGMGRRPARAQSAKSPSPPFAEK